jgi:signal transduction histidine kinase/ligand-binding sensor domain-containing protein
MSERTTHRMFVFFPWLFLTHFCFAQSYLLSSLPVEKDLSSRQITSIFQDSRGFIWIGTQDGLNLYNANSVKIFKHDVKNKNSIANNYVQNICEGIKANIWIATAMSVDRYIPSTNSFSHFTADDQKNTFGYKPKVYVDNNQNTWISGDGLFKFDPKIEQFKKIINPYSSGLLGSRLANMISGFYNDSKGRYWISTYDGLFLYNDDKKTFERFDVPPNDDNYKRFGILFSSVYEDMGGGLWVGTWGYGIFKISTTERKLLPIGAKDVTLTYSSQDLNGQSILWCSFKGLESIDRENKIVTQLSHVNDDPFSVRKDVISVLFTDKQNQLWIGYEKEGIQILSPGNQSVKTYPVSSNQHNISSIGVIAEKNNSLYLGGWYIHALCKLNKNYEVVKWWDYLPPTKNNSSSNVGDIYFDKDGNDWVATANGLVFINEQTGQIKNYAFDSSISKRSFFLRILPEGDSVLWLAGYDNGLSRFSLKTFALELFGGKPLPFYWKIVFDNERNIWCANNEGSLDKFDRQKKVFTHYHFDSLTEKSNYFDLAYDSTSNGLWIASSNGLVNFSLNDMHAKLFVEKDGLPTSKINLLTWDEHQRLWIGTDRGLSLLDTHKRSFRNFYMNNGLVTEKLDHCLSVGVGGKLYIGDDDRIMVMDINSLQENSELSPVYITSASENGNLLNIKTKNNEQVIELPYFRNNLSFDFAITDFINPEDNQLFYQLERWDQDFTRTKKGEAVYNKLPPGKYIFHVKGVNHNGVVNDDGGKITVIIHPPFWETAWFLTLVSVALFTVFALIVRYISQRNLKEKLLKLEKEQAVEKERNRISQDMHDDLGSGLTKIAILSEVVKKQINNPEKAKQQLENISESSRELVDNLQDIIWILNPKNDTLENLAAYIREYALKFFEPFGIEVQFGYPEKFPEIKLSEETRRNIFLALKESFNNIGKHAWCNKVKIYIEETNREIRIIVQDDGKGFDAEKVRHFGNGLVNMQHRIEQIGGKYEITSKTGTGTKTKIEIPV